MKSLHQKRNQLLLFALVCVLVGSLASILAWEKKLLSEAIPAPDYAVILAEEVARDISEKGSIPAIVTREKSFRIEIPEDQNVREAATVTIQESMKNLRFVNANVEVAEVVITEKELAVVFYRAMRLNSKEPGRVFDPQKAEKRFGQVGKRRYAALIYAYTADLARMELERVHWRSSGAPVLQEFCQNVPRFMWLGRLRIVFPQSPGGLIDRLRWRAARRFRVASSFFRWTLPLCSLLGLSYCGFELLSSYKRFCDKDLVELARRIQKEFGFKHPGPSIWIFFRASDIAKLHAKTLWELKHLRNALARQETEEAIRSSKERKALRVVASTGGSSSRLGKNRTQRIEELKLELDQLIATVTWSPELWNQYEGALSCGTEKEKLRALGCLARELRAQRSPAANLPEGTVVEQNERPGELRLIKMDDLLLEVFSLDQIRLAIPWRVDARCVRALIVTLFQARIFDARYRAESTVKNIARNVFLRLENCHADPKSLEKALRWLIREGVLVTWDKRPELTLSLTSKIGGKSVSAQKLIRLVLVARDVVQHGADV